MKRDSSLMRSRRAARLLALSALLATGCHERPRELASSDAGTSARMTPSPLAATPPSPDAGAPVDVQALLATLGPLPDGGTAPQLDAQVQRVLRTHWKELGHCWDGRSAPSPAGETTMITVAIDGVGHATARAGQDDPTLEECIESTVAKWRFPATGASTTFPAPYVRSSTQQLVQPNAGTKYF